MLLSDAMGIQVDFSTAIGVLPENYLLSELCSCPETSSVIFYKKDYTFYIWWSKTLIINYMINVYEIRTYHMHIYNFILNFLLNTFIIYLDTRWHFLLFIMSHWHVDTQWGKETFATVSLHPCLDGLATTIAPGMLYLQSKVLHCLPVLPSPWSTMQPYQPWNYWLPMLSAY